MHTILVLEDDIELNNTICCSLEKNGYRVMGARACLKIKNCTKHLFLSPFYSIIKKKGCSLC